MTSTVRQSSSVVFAVQGRLQGVCLTLLALIGQCDKQERPDSVWSLAVAALPAVVALPDQGESALPHSMIK